MKKLFELWKRRKALKYFLYVEDHHEHINDLCKMLDNEKINNYTMTSRGLRDHTLECALAILTYSQRDLINCYGLKDSVILIEQATQLASIGRCLFESNTVGLQSIKLVGAIREVVMKMQRIVSSKKVNVL
jgi:hypothetical protein